VSDFLKNLLGSEGESESGGLGEHETSELPTQPGSSPTKNKFPQDSSNRPPQFNVGLVNSIGLLRDHNEDALFAMTTYLISDDNSLPFGLYIIADGMGGHLHGEKASQVAIHAMSMDVISKVLPSVQEASYEFPADTLQSIMKEGVQAAHQAIVEQAPGGGSTLTGILLLHDQMTIAHIGDSRAYAIDSQGSLNLLTTDHSLVKRLVDLGQITSDEAAIHPQRNVLYRALGQAEKVDADLISAPIPKSGYLMLCSDGLWGVVPEDEMVNIISTASTLQNAGQSLLEAANTAGGPDNISVIIIEMSGEPL
jgi:serine/threonine protein phosphatase PrpC